MKSAAYIFLLCFLFALAIKTVVSNPLEHVKRDDDMSNPKIECNIHNDSPMVSDFDAAKTSLEAPGRVCEQTKCLNYFNPYCTYDANNKECTRIAEHNSLLIEICGKYKLVAQCRSAVSAAQELKAKCKGSFGGVERFGGTARYKWGYIKVRKV